MNVQVHVPFFIAIIMMPITLVGYRGSGKSTVGAQLAARLKYQFIDADTELQQRAGMTIAEIFATHGEPWFRSLERQILGELLQREDLVIAAGGGAVLDDGTRQRMRESGPVVWLKGDVETLLTRIQQDSGSATTRPALTSHADPLLEVRELLARREPLYAEVASITVLTDRRSVTSIVDEIVSQLPADGETCW